jgi:UDP-2-acetamido-2-deoxy-ribo-hexuluronate aminotransferase
MQAAILLAKMEVFEEEVAARGRLGARYTELFAHGKTAQNGPVRTPWLASDCTSVFAQYTIEVHDRAAVEASLKQAAIPTAVHYPVPLHLQPVFADCGYGAGSFPVAEAAARRVISLPMHPYLTDEQQRSVVEAVRTALAS